MLTHTLGFPRIGADRDLKKALEAFWQGQIEEADLQGVARDLRLRHWRLQADRGVDLVPVGDFSLYDHVLDTTAMLGAVPDRYGWGGRLTRPPARSGGRGPGGGRTGPAGAAGALDLLAPRQADGGRVRPTEPR